MKKRILTYLSLIVELLLLIGNILPLFRPLSKYEYRGEELIAPKAQYIENFMDENRNGYYLDELVAIEEGSSEECYIKTPGTDLKKGSYEVRIKYKTGCNSVTYKTGSASNYYQMKIGRQNVQLNRDKEECIFTIESNLDVEEYTVRVNLNGENYIFIDEVSITETNSAKIRNLVEIILLIIVINSVWIIYKRKPKTFERKKIIIATLLGSCIVFVSIPIWTSYLYYGHDIYFHLNRIEGIKNALLAGNIPVRMHYSALKGAGYPTSIFYGDILLYIPAVLRVLGWSVQSAYQGYILFINILTCVFAYKVFLSIFKNEWIAVFGSYMYMMAPYRLGCIYLRAAVGEYTAACFYPLIIYGLYYIYNNKENKKKNNGWIALAIGFSGLLLSHIISTFITFCVVLLVCILFIKETFRKEIFVELCKAVLLALGICAGFLIPFIDYMSAEIVVNVTAHHGDFGAGTVAISQLLSIFPHGKGYSQSVYSEITSPYLEMPYALGGALVLAPVIYLIYYLYVEYGQNEKEKLGKTALGLAGLCLFMTTYYFPWNEVEKLGELVRYFMYSIQFPWRLLSVSSILLVVVLTAAVSGMKEHLNSAVYYNIIAILCVLAFVSSNYFISDFMRNAEKNYVVAEGDVDNGMIGNGEYLLVGATTEYEGILHEEEKVSIADAKRVKDVYLVECDNMTDEVQYIQIPIINYDNYRATDVATGDALKIETGEQCRIKVELPENYSGKIEIEYKAPWYWHLSEVVSLATLAGIGILFWQRRKENRI